MERELTSHPELIYLKFENAKWRIHKDLEQGVYPMKATSKTWIISEGTKICAKRMGSRLLQISDRPRTQCRELH